MPEQNQIDQCVNCSSQLSGNFCANCGYPEKLRRINGKYIASEIGSVLNFDRGILFTIRELLVRPGFSIRKFIVEDRNRLVKPIVFIIVCSLIYSFCQQLFRFEDGYISHSLESGSAVGFIFEWISSNYGYANILMAIFIAFWIKIFFRKYGYNFFEILILLCFGIGIGMLIFSVFGIIEAVTDLKLFDKSALIGILYISWAIGQFFDKKKFMNYLKAFFSYCLGMITFSIVALAIGFAIDYLK